MSFCTQVHKSEFGEQPVRGPKQLLNLNSIKRTRTQTIQFRMLSARPNMYLLLICIIHRRHVAAQHGITSLLEFILCQLYSKQGQQETSLLAPNHNRRGGKEVSAEISKLRSIPNMRRCMYVGGLKLPVATSTTPPRLPPSLPLPHQRIRGSDDRRPHPPRDRRSTRPNFSYLSG